MASTVEIVNELGKVRLAPLVLPLLRMIDPIMGALPQGSLQSIVSRKDRRDNLVKTVEAASPVLPDMIRFLGHVAESKLATGLLSLCATVSVPFLKLFAPALSRLLVPLSGPALGLAGRSGSVLPSLTRGLDALLRWELAIERPLRGMFERG